MIIDAHAHIFPDKIASRAADGISSFYDIPVRFDGSVGQLLEINRKAGVDRAIVQSVATVPEQVRNINNFISEQVRLHPEQLIGFGALHPDFPDIAGETERIISLGLRGIKLHSDFQRFNIDDPKAFRRGQASDTVPLRGRALRLFLAEAAVQRHEALPEAHDNRRSPRRLD